MFPPVDVYDRLYRVHISALEARLGLHGMSCMVGRSFASIAGLGEAIQATKYTQHVSRIQQCSFMASVVTVRSCAVCIIGKSNFVLDCGHVLCEGCTTLLAREVQPWEFQVDMCWVCRSPNIPSFRVKPPTASARVLELTGTCPDRTLSFLQALQRSPAMTAVVLRQWFDSVLADDIGNYIFSFF